jgi:hypothetical protein
MCYTPCTMYYIATLCTLQSSYCHWHCHHCHRCHCDSSPVLLLLLPVIAPDCLSPPGHCRGGTRGVMYYVLCTTYYVLHRGAIYVHCIVTSVTGIAITVTVVTVTSSSPCHLHSLSSPLASSPVCSQYSSRHRSFPSQDYQTTCLPSPGHRRGDPRGNLYYAFTPYTSHILYHCRHCRPRHCRYCHCRYRHCTVHSHYIHRTSIVTIVTVVIVTVAIVTIAIVTVALNLPHHCH